MSENQGSASGATSNIANQDAARVYAEALLNTAEQQNAIQDEQEELESLLGEIYQSQPLLAGVMADRSISRERKASMIRSVFEGRASRIFVNLLLILNDHDRLDLLPDIYREYVEALNRREKRIRAHVRSAVELSEEQLEQLKRELREAFQKEPLLETEIDPDILGGLVVQVGDWLFDASVRSRLERMQNHLIESSTHELENRRDRFGTFTATD